MNNYRIDIFRDCGAHYEIEFPEFYLAKMFALRISEESDVTHVFELERISDGTFDIVRRFK